MNNLYVVWVALSKAEEHTLKLGTFKCVWSCFLCGRTGQMHAMNGGLELAVLTETFLALAPEELKLCAV